MREFGPAVYGAWILICAVAAKCPMRGVLADADGPLSALDIADKTDCPVAVIEQALSALTNERIGWLELANLPEFRQINSESAGTPADGAGTPVLPDQTRQDQTEPDKTKTSTSTSTGTGVVESESGSGKNWGSSVFKNLRNEDLPVDEVLDDWLRFATDAKRADNPLFRDSGGYSDANKLLVFAAAERAIEEGQPPLKLFKFIVGKLKWSLITQAQEDRAAARIKRMRMR
jgi:hypothetical protein